MPEDCIKEGLSECSPIGKGVEKKSGMVRDNPGQVPTKPSSESVSKAGKSFKIT